MGNRRYFAVSRKEPDGQKKDGKEKEPTIPPVAFLSLVSWESKKAATSDINLM